MVLLREENPLQEVGWSPHEAALPHPIWTADQLNGVQVRAGVPPEHFPKILCTKMLAREEGSLRKCLHGKRSVCGNACMGRGVFVEMLAWEDESLQKCLHGKRSVCRNACMGRGVFVEMLAWEEGCFFI